MRSRRTRSGGVRLAWVVNAETSWRALATWLSIVPVNTATRSATPTANPTWRDMFTMPEPRPSSWPLIEPIEPIEIAGKVAPIPAPMRIRGPTTEA